LISSSAWQRQGRSRIRQDDCFPKR
jgi:hypothetical protein